MMARIIATHRDKLRKLVNWKKKSSTKETYEWLGCDKEFLKSWLESNFTEGMTWENHGKFWSVDHVIACANFDLMVPEQRSVCFHWSNLFPLTRKDNTEKSAKIFDDYILEVQKRAECFVNKCKC